MTTLSKAEYLQRYLSGNEDDKKKKKKKKVKEPPRGSGLRIVEDDAFIAVSANYKDIDTDEEKEDIEIIESISRQVEAKAREAPKFRSSFRPLDEVKQEPGSPSTAENGVVQSVEQFDIRNLNLAVLQDKMEKVATTPILTFHRRGGVILNRAHQKDGMILTGHNLLSVTSHQKGKDATQTGRLPGKVMILKHTPGGADMIPISHRPDEPKDHREEDEIPAPTFRLLASKNLLVKTSQ
ncbi:hypothetical protein TELCIR_04214 [Teladorsagia circumcincta]|uniref:Uncharacterized protein n=1 Tax=Teladorsagia circumcincta TaxID=45464 RepID=A0A2G9UUA0_TELCI|nr:hypothetical protein TELCIR_04214 [Teladorsagia circumcincta]